MNDMDYTNTDFPEEFDLQHEGKPPEEVNPYLLMSTDDFRMHVVGMLEQAFNNESAINDAVQAAFGLMEERLATMEENMRKLRTKIYEADH